MYVCIVSVSLQIEKVLRELPLQFILYILITGYMLLLVRKDKKQKKSQKIRSVYRAGSGCGCRWADYSNSMTITERNVGRFIVNHFSLR